MTKARSIFSLAFIVSGLLTGVSGVALAQDDSTIKFVNGPPQTADNTNNIPTVSVTAIAPAPMSIVVSWGSLQVSDLVSTHLAMPSNLKPAAIPQNNKNPCDSTGAPILPGSGAKVETYTDFALPGEMGLKFVRYYNTSAYPNWSNSFDYWLDNTCGGGTDSGKPCNAVTVYRPDGSTLVFKGGAIAYGTFTTGTAALTHNTDGTYTVQDEDTLVESYSAAGVIQSIKDLSGIGWTFTYPSTPVTVVTHTNGQQLTLTLSDTGSTLTDPAGNVYSYTGVNNVVTLPGSPATVITYKYANFTSAALSLLTEVDYNGVPYAYTSYDATTGWATSTYLADNTQLASVIYGTNSSGFLTAAITNPLGNVSTHTYGGMNGQLSSVSGTAVADCGSTVNSDTYDTNGNLQQTTDNNGNVHTYTYAVNGQLQTETEAYGTPQARTTNYVWDPNVQLNRLTSATVVGWSETAYTYNAQNRLASVTVTNLSGNGTSGQALTTLYNYTLYANGMVQTESVTHPSPNNSDTDVATYDALGNVTSVANGLGQTTTYSNYTALGEPQQVVGPNGDTTNYTYDARGRVVTKTMYPNGAAATSSYTYDGFGLLYTETTPDNEVTTWNRNAEMMVQTITHNDKDGTSTETFGYDPMGDVTSHVVTRGSVVGLSESASYDALGRVYQKQGMHGQTLTYGYDGNGNVLSVTNAAGHLITYQYDALNRVTATAESGGASPLMPSAAPTLTAPATSSTGSYAVSWTAVSGALAYNLQEQVNGGSWALVTNTGSTSWSAASQPSGTYGYRVQACDSAGCGPWSTTGSAAVSIPTAPTTSPALSVPATSTTGSYTVSWGSVSGAGSYTLQQLAPGGSWAAVLSSAALSWSASGEASGSYSYQVQACNAVGCGPWSGVATDTVTLPPIPATPSMTVPSTNATGSYTVSWSGVSYATSYTMQEQVNGGGWSTVSASAATNWAASVANGTYGYRVQACGVSGCSAWSGTDSVVVTNPVPIAINGQSYGVGEQVAQKTTGQAEIGFAIAGGNTWKVFTANGNLVTQTVVATGAVPATAVTVQNTWTLLGIPSGDLTSGGAVTNYASSPTALSSNPFSDYTTTAYGGTSVARGAIYQLTVTFFNAAGTNVSSSTATLTANIVGSE